MPPQVEYDFPPGHPARADYDPKSKEAAEYARQFVHPLGERDFPVDHPGALDTPGNMNKVTWRAGVDPRNPHREPFTGRTPEQVAGVKALSAAASKRAKESAAPPPIDSHQVAQALDSKRAAVGHDILTAEEYSEVLAQFHSVPPAPPATPTGAGQPDSVDNGQ